MPQKVVLKFKISSRDVPALLTMERGSAFRISMPKDAIFMDVQPQREINEQNIPQITGSIWMLCNPEEKQMEERSFKLIETGKPFDFEDNDFRPIYRGTYQLFNGSTVLHLFEIQ